MPGSDRIQLALAACLLVASGLACAAGGARGGQSNEPAELVTTSAQSESGYFTKIIELDGEEVSDSSFSLDPGRHSVRVVGKCAPRDKGVAMGAALFSPAVALGASIAAAVDAEKSAKFSGRMKACFIARPGRTYEVRTYAEGGVWKVEVVDQTTTYDVKSPCKSPKTPELRLTGGPQRSPHPFDE